MCGGVWEWVSDWYDAEYYGESEAKNPTGPRTGTGWIMRGGSWADDAVAKSLDYISTPEARAGFWNEQRASIILNLLKASVVSDGR